MLIYLNFIIIKILIIMVFIIPATFGNGLERFFFQK